jgi:uncharacterized protein DUF1569
MRTLAELRDKADIQSRLGRLRSESQPRFGRMAAPQAVCHCADVFRASLGRMSVSMDTRLFNRTVLKWIAFHLPWPKGVIATRPEFDQWRGAGTKPGDFARDVAELESLTEEFSAADLDGRIHPLFGPLTRAEWLRWGYLHLDHHLSQFGV